jgi:hypothetical protein
LNGGETKGEEVERVEGPVVQEFLADRNVWGFRRAIEVEIKLGKDDFNTGDLEITLRRYQELKAEFSKAGMLKEEKPIWKESDKMFSKPLFPEDLYTQTKSIW